VQAEKANHFELGKTTAELLVAILWPLELVGSGIWHRQTGTINNFDPPAQPKLLVGDLALELLGHLGANLLGHSLHRAAREPDSSRWYHWKASFDRENAFATKRSLFAKRPDRRAAF
jgi:hypothetical protein